MYLNIMLSGLSIAESLSKGGMTTLIGLGMTFVMLALLIGAIVVLRYILKGLDTIIPKCKEKLLKKNTTPLTETNVEHNDSSSVVEEQEVDVDTLAVIEQSIRTYTAKSNDGKPHDRIRIISVKEVKHE